MTPEGTTDPVAGQVGGRAAALTGKGKGLFHLEGVVTFFTLESLLREEKRLFSSLPETGLRLDCTAVARMDSAGAALLVRWLRLCRETGRTFELRNLPPQSHSILQANRLEKLFF